MTAGNPRAAVPPATAAAARMNPRRAGLASGAEEFVSLAMRGLPCGPARVTRMVMATEPGFVERRDARPIPGPVRAGAIVGLFPTPCRGDPRLDPPDPP